MRHADLHSTYFARCADEHDIDCDNLVLEVGTFTGFSALAWHEGTRATKAEIITLDVRGEVLNFTRKMFSDLGVDDRIKVIEGPAAST